MKNFEIKTLTVGQLQTNCYILIDEDSKQILIIDPGDDADYIIRILQDYKAIPVMILATHGHFDHLLGVLELQLSYNIPFLVHKKDEFLIKNMQKNAQYFLRRKVDPIPIINDSLSENRIIKIGDQTLLVIETPGHTPGSVCLYLKKQNTLFSGDTIFANGDVGRTDFSYSSKDQLTQSLNKIFKLPVETLIYPGHGESSSLKKEKLYH